MKIKYVILALTIYLFNSCHEVYEPDLDKDMKGLIVSGLISNAHQSYSVRLSWATPFNSKERFALESNATVTISDDCNNTFQLGEITPGTYITNPSTFIPQIGNSYKLTFELENGDEYESDYQELLPPISINNLYGSILTKEFLVGNENGTLIQAFDGVETYIDLAFNENSMPMFRFDVSLLIEFAYSVVIGGNIIDYYCWSKTRPNINVNISSTKYDSKSTGITKHTLCFLPFSRFYWGLNHDYNAMILTVKGYRLNDQSYTYYKQSFEQLEASNSIFGPTATQLQGNIHCKSDPKKIVLGFFEASSMYECTYIMKTRNSDGIPFLYAPGFPTDISVNGCNTSTPPSFWYSKFYK